VSTGVSMCVLYAQAGLDIFVCGDLLCSQKKVSIFFILSFCLLSFSRPLIAGIQHAAHEEGVAIVTASLTAGVLAHPVNDLAVLAADEVVGRCACGRLLELLDLGPTLRLPLWRPVKGLERCRVVLRLLLDRLLCLDRRIGQRIQLGEEVLRGDIGLDGPDAGGRVPAGTGLLEAVLHIERLAGHDDRIVFGLKRDLCDGHCIFEGDCVKGLSEPSIFMSGVGT
jgi:hypothetical protein